MFRIHESTNHCQDHGFVTQANPSILTILCITVVSCPHSYNKHHWSLERGRKGFELRPLDMVEYHSCQNDYIFHGCRSNFFELCGCLAALHHNLTTNRRVHVRSPTRKPQARTHELALMTVQSPSGTCAFATILDIPLPTTLKTNNHCHSQSSCTAVSSVPANATSVCRSEEFTARLRVWALGWNWKKRHTQSSHRKRCGSRQVNAEKLRKLSECARRDTLAASPSRRAGRH